MKKYFVPETLPRAQQPSQLGTLISETVVYAEFNIRQVYFRCKICH